LSAARDGLFNIFAATLHIAGRSSIRILRTVKVTHLLRVHMRHRNKTIQDKITLLVLDIVGLMQVLKRQ